MMTAGAAAVACWVLAPPLPPAAAVGLLTQLVVTHKTTKLGICSENIGEDCLWFNLVISVRIEVAGVLTRVSHVSFNRVPAPPPLGPPPVAVLDPEALDQ